MPSRAQMTGPAIVTATARAIRLRARTACAASFVLERAWAAPTAGRDLRLGGSRWHEGRPRGALLASVPDATSPTPAARRLACVGPATSPAQYPAAFGKRLRLAPSPWRSRPGRRIMHGAARPQRPDPRSRHEAPQRRSCSRRTRCRRRPGRSRPRRELPGAARDPPADGLRGRYDEPRYGRDWPGGPGHLTDRRSDHHGTDRGRLLRRLIARSLSLGSPYKTLGRSPKLRLALNPLTGQSNGCSARTPKESVRARRQDCGQPRV